MNTEEWSRVSIVVLNFNGGEYVLRCLKSILNCNYPDFEVILVDNASTDNSLRKVRKLFGSDARFQIVSNSKNLGYAEGNNTGARCATGKFIIFLNFDTEVEQSWLRELVKVMDAKPDIGIAQCKLLLMDNPRMLDNTGHYIDCFGIAYFMNYQREDAGQFNHVCDIFGASGAALAVRADLFRKLNGFDPDFFLFFEESDLCWRTWLANYRVVFVPTAIVYHKGGASYRERTAFDAKAAYFFIRNRLTSMLKNYELKNLLKYLPINIIIMVGISLMEVKKCNIAKAKAMIKGVLWNFFTLRKTYLKRKTVQSVRVISDNYLLDKKVIKAPTIQRIKRKFQIGY